MMHMRLPHCKHWAYYYWGSFYRDKNNYSQALDKYDIALSHINDRPENAELKASLYSNLGYLYYTQDLNCEADSIYQQAELLAKSQKDTVSLCYALSQRGMISLEQGKKYYPKAEQQILQALSIGKVSSDSTILVPIYHSLSVLYNLMPKPGPSIAICTPQLCLPERHPALLQNIPAAGQCIFPKRPI